MPEPLAIPSLTTLRARASAEAARAAGRNRRDYLRALDAAYTAHLQRQAQAQGRSRPDSASLPAAIATELTALAGAQRVRASIAAWLVRVPEAPVQEPRPVAAAVRQLRSGAQGGLRTLDTHADHLQRWLDIIARVPDDVGSPDAVALAHADAIVGLLGHAQRVLDLPEELARQAAVVETLATEWLGAPSEFAPGIGPRPPLPPDPAASRPRRAASGLSGDAA